MFSVCGSVHGNRNQESLFSHSVSPCPCYISISAGALRAQMRVPHLCLRLNEKHAADRAWEVFLLCFILFPRHYILTLTFGCDKRKALNPTDIHYEFQSLDPAFTPTHTAHSKDCCVVLGQCTDYDGVDEAFLFFLSLASAMLMTEWVSLTIRERLLNVLCAVLSTFLSFIQISASFSDSLQLCSCVGMTSEALL